MIYSDPVGMPGIAVLMAGFGCFLLALLIARLRRVPPDTGDGKRVRKSWAGVFVQGFGIGIGAFGPVLVGLDPTSGKAIAQAVEVGILMFGAVAIFAWSTATMGRNWSLVARTRSDHSLVQTGPFAWVRHPIYTAMAMIMFALSIAFGHTPQLLVAVPVFALGTWLRIREEERLLKTMFGPHYDAYAARVKRFVPGVF